MLVIFFIWFAYICIDFNWIWHIYFYVVFDLHYDLFSFFVNRKIKVNFSKSVVILLLFTCELSCALHVLSLRLLVWSAGQQLAIQYKVRLEFRVASKSTHVANQSACCHLVYWSGPVNNSPILQKCPCNSISWLSNLIIFLTTFTLWYSRLIYIRLFRRLFFDQN